MKIESWKKILKVLWDQVNILFFFKLHDIVKKKKTTTTNNKNFVRNFSYFYREKMFILTVFSSIGYAQKKTQSTYTLSVSRFKS